MHGKLVSNSFKQVLESTATKQITTHATLQSSDTGITHWAGTHQLFLNVYLTVSSIIVKVQKKNQQKKTSRSETSNRMSVQTGICR